MAGFMVLQVWRERMTLRWDAESQDARFVPESEAHGFDDLPEIIASEIEGYAEPNIGGEGSLAWFARYSAPGYMDRTDTAGPGPTAIEAGIACWDLYDGDAEELVTTLARVGCEEADVRSMAGL